MMIIKDGMNDFYMKITEDHALRVENLSQLISTLKHLGAWGDCGIKMKDIKTGETFSIAYLGREEEDS